LADTVHRDLKLENILVKSSHIDEANEIRHKGTTTIVAVLLQELVLISRYYWETGL